ncbi:MAG: asparaginase [Candidatus Hermodarchaeota archaeon]
MSDEKRRILLLQTGGTIASSIDKETNSLKPSTTLEALLENLVSEDLNIELDVKNILNLDSSNFHPQHWQILARAIIKDYDSVDGIVVTHGTDTMPYTASALAFMLRDLGKPIVLTGSQIPIIYSWSDARKNLADALRIAAYTDLAEVVIAFNGEIHRATRVKKVRERALDVFDSIDPTPLGFLSRDVMFYGNYRVRSDSKPYLDDKLDSHVFLLKMFPGLIPETIKAIMDVGHKALIIEGFGSGNVSIVGNSVIPVLKTIIDEGKTVVLSTQCAFGQAEPTLYEVGKKVIDIGGLSARDMPSEIAVVKMMWILGHTDDPKTIKEMLYTNYAGEVSEVSFAGLSGT